MGRVREAKKKDLDAIVELFAYVQREHRAKDPKRFRLVDPKPTKKVLAGYLKNDDLRFCVAEFDGEIVGYSLFRKLVEPEDLTLMQRQSFYVLHLVVDAGHQRRGFGTMLLEDIRQQAREANVRTIRLGAFAVNEGGLAFYERLGFAPAAIDLERNALEPFTLS